MSLTNLNVIMKETRRYEVLSQVIVKVNGIIWIHSFSVVIYGMRNIYWVREGGLWAPWKIFSGYFKDNVSSKYEDFRCSKGEDYTLDAGNTDFTRLSRMDVLISGFKAVIILLDDGLAVCFLIMHTVIPPSINKHFVFCSWTQSL